jgi:lipopolysaccharide transport system permease protein
MIRLLLLFFFLFIGGIFPHPLALFLPLSLLPILLLSIGLGMFLSIIGAVFKDLSNFVNLFLTTAMFMTPVLYPFPESGLLKAINVYNPLYYLVEVPRGIFFQGQFSHGVEYSICTLLSVGIFLAGWRFYQVAMARIVEKV